MARSRGSARESRSPSGYTKTEIFLKDSKRHHGNTRIDHQVISTRIDSTAVTPGEIITFNSSQPAAEKITATHIRITQKFVYTDQES